MITTFRLAQQTSRWARFAAVTVDVVAAMDRAVAVADSATNNPVIALEASCGARRALSLLPASSGDYRVTVTGISATDADTGIGDVHEATARAVWQALQVTAPPTYVGFCEPDMVAAWARDRIGLRLVAVTEARHWFDGERDTDTGSLVHAWLHFDRRPPTKVHGHGDDLLLHTADPYTGYDMREYGQVRVGPASPRVLACRAPIRPPLRLCACRSEVPRGDRGDIWVDLLALDRDRDTAGPSVSWRTAAHAVDFAPSSDP